MQRIFIAVVAATGLLFSMTLTTDASGYCPSKPNGKCPSARKNKPDSKDNYTAEQRAALRKKYNLACMKAYPGSRLERIDYRSNKYICTY